MELSSIVLKQVIIIFILILTVSILLYIYELDGRKCLDCPYVEKLYTDNLIISNDNGNHLQTTNCFNNGNTFCYRAVVIVETPSSDLKATGEITIKYDCDYQVYNWGFGGKNYIDKKLTGRYTFEVEEESSKRVDFDIIRMDGSGINYIKCDFDIEKANGNLLIYGERVR